MVNRPVNLFGSALIGALLALALNSLIFAPTTAIAAQETPQKPTPAFVGIPYTASSASVAHETVVTYRILQLAPGRSIQEDTLNAMAAQGWEYHSTPGGAQFIFVKRS
jgi:hypothetical protein